MINLGILHPGQMGISVAASAKNSGCTVYWVGAGRSEQSHARAEQHGLRDAGSLADLCRLSEVIVCVCPPHAAEEVAEEVMAQGFQGIYVDANAIAPQRANNIAAQITSGGATFVDGGIVGGPAWKPGTTWLYLSGPAAGQAAAAFAAGPLATQLIGNEIGKASALKMCYAALTKGTTALLAATFGAAHELGVLHELMAEWGRDGAKTGQENERKVREVTAKAWRFTGEMDEIAATFAAAGMPAGFHQAAAEIYQRLADFKDASATPGIEEVLAALQTQPKALSMSFAVETLLAIDTATASASVALYDLTNGLLLAESTWQARRRHTQDLLVMTQALMTQLGVLPAQVRGLAVTTGPGSFTGVRIALSVVKGFGVGLPTPPQVVGLPTLTVTAAPWLPLAQAASARLWAYIQAGRGRYNWAIFDKTLYHPGAADHQAGSAADFASALAAQDGQTIWLVGEAAPDLLDAVAPLRPPLGNVIVVDPISAMRRAGLLAHLAAQQIAAGQVHDLATLQPLYLQGL